MIRELMDWSLVNDKVMVMFVMTIYVLAVIALGLLFAKKEKKL